jgi:tRNA dimethylallyltransferase
MYLDAVLRGYRLVEVAEDPALRAILAGLSDTELRRRLQQLKPQLHNRTDLEKRERLVRAIEIAEGERTAVAEAIPSAVINPLVFGLRWPREVLRRRIARRLEQRFAAGMIDEVVQLHAAGVSWEQLEFYGLEYRLIAQFLQGRFNRDDLTRKLHSAIGQFAKRQETFFRRMEKQGVRIHWLTGGLDSHTHVSQVLELMQIS